MFLKWKHFYRNRSTLFTLFFMYRVRLDQTIDSVSGYFFRVTWVPLTKSVTNNQSNQMANLGAF